MNKHLNVLTDTRHIESQNLVASCVNELDDTLPRLTGVQWDSVRATHSVSAEAYTWKMTLGWGRTRLDSLTVSWTIATRVASVAHVCHVVRFRPLQDWLLIQIFATPSDMGDGLLTVFKGSNYTFIMLYLVHEMDMDYFIVDEMINIKIVWSQLHA
jgi:hypothetical protein